MCVLVSFQLVFADNVCASWYYDRIDDIGEIEVTPSSHSRQGCILRRCTLNTQREICKYVLCGCVHLRNEAALLI